MAAAKATAKPVDEIPQVVINQVNVERLAVPIVGTAPLIVHRFAEKAKRQMLDNMQGRKSPKAAKDPEREYEDSIYRLKDGTPGFPSVAFKSATVGGARFYSQVTMTALKQCLFMRGELGPDGQMMVRIDGEHRMREDVVRVARGGTDLRYRAEFIEWSTVLEVTYVLSMLTRESVLSLIDAGGLGVGVGEWRPEKGGDFGTFAVDATRNIEVIER